MSCWVDVARIVRVDELDVRDHCRSAWDRVEGIGQAGRGSSYVHGVHDRPYNMIRLTDRDTFTVHYRPEMQADHVA